MARTNRRHHAGFTLVELLVVLVVLSILAALLVPVLGKVRDRAKETICLNHLRQIGVGLKLYQGDNQGRYPLGTTLKGGAGTLVPSGTANTLMWDFTGAIGGRDGKEEVLMLPPANVRPLNRYVTDARSFSCPADGGVDYRANGGPHWKSLWDSFGCSYQYNGPGGSDAVSRTRIGGKDDTWAMHASRFVVLYEPPARRLSWKSQGFYVYWHRACPPRTINNNRNNVGDGRLISPILFADGHAEIADFTDEGGSGTNSDRWLWYQPQ